MSGSSKISKVIKYALSTAVAAVLLYFSFRGVDWTAFIEGVRNCRWWYVVLAMFASVAAFFFRSERWRILLHPFDATLDPLSTFNGVNIGYLANFVFPRIGEVVRCGLISRRSTMRHPSDPENAVTFDKAVGTVLLSRVWDIIVVFLLLGMLLASRWDKFGSFFADSMWRPIRENFSRGTILAAVAALLVAVIFIWALLHCSGRGGFLRRAADFCRGIGDGFRSFLRMDAKGAFMLYTVLIWAMYWLMSMSVLWAMPQMDSMTWVDAFFVTLAGSVAWMVPVPGGFGAYHGLVALALSSIYGFAWDTGLLCATLNHEAQTITMLLCGTISYFIEITRKQI